MNYHRLLTAMFFACFALPAFTGLKEANLAMEKEDPDALKEWKALAAFSTNTARTLRTVSLFCTSDKTLALTCSSQCSSKAPPRSRDMPIAFY